MRDRSQALQSCRRFAIVCAIAGLIALAVTLVANAYAHARDADHYVARVIEAALGQGMSLIDAATYGELAMSEGLRLDPYEDVAGVRTVCFGETAGVEDRRYTLDECVTMFLSRTEHDFAEPVARCTRTWEALPVLAREAVIQFAYNVGVGNYCGSSVRRQLDQGRGAAACERILLWNKVRQGGELVVSPGLTNRREREAAECREGFQ